MPLNAQIKEKLQKLPAKPGVYLMRDRTGKIIYIGKAISLRSRVRSYFQKATLRSAPPKLRGLIATVEDLEIIVLRNEAEALLTESRLIQAYHPRFNVMMRDDKRYLLLRIDLNEPFPRFRTSRLRKQDGAVYFGPYTDSAAAREAIEFCEKTFGLRSCSPRIPDEENYKHCLNDVIRFCSAPCIQRVDQKAYRESIDEALRFMRGERPDLLKQLQESMREAAGKQDYEKAAAIRDTLHLLRKAVRDRSRGTSDMKMKCEEAKKGVQNLQTILDLPEPPAVIECFDISNISGTFAVASMVCSVDGMPRPSRYRLFRIKTVHGIDDPGMMREAVGRRYRRLLDEKKPLPNLVLVDGGITQLRAAQGALNELGLTNLPLVGLAKQFEEIHYEQKGDRTPIRLPLDSNALIILRRIRDEAHRFALTYHRKLRQQRITESMLDEIEGIGSKRKTQLLSHFGSMQRLRKASQADIAKVSGFGKTSARLIYETLHPKASDVTTS